VLAVVVDIRVVFAVVVEVNSEVLSVVLEDISKAVAVVVKDIT
jgi:hypothetical protein